MQSFILIALFIASGGNAEVIRRYHVVPFVMGGSQAIFSINGIETGEDALLECVIRFTDGRDSIIVTPVMPIHGQSVICRLPPEINSGSVVVNLQATNMGKRNARAVRNAADKTQPTKTVLLSEEVFINPSPSVEVVVEENWITNRLSFTWHSEYFQQFFYPGDAIMLQVTMYAAKSMEPVFTSTEYTEIMGMNTGAATIHISNENIDKISDIRYPYFYAITVVGNPDLQMSSIIFAPTLGMTKFEAARTCELWLENANVPTPEEIHPCPRCLCQVKLDENFFQSEYDPNLLKLTNGDLDNYELYYERVPTDRGRAQTCAYDRVTGDLATTSPAQASWIHSVSKYRSYQDNFFEDIWPYIACCLHSNNSQHCDLFHEKRPIDTGREYDGPEDTSCGWGDPHFVTYNKLEFDFMGNGEFWLIRGPAGSGFGVQGRMAPKAAWPGATLFNAIAIKDGNTTVQMQLKFNESSHLFLNGIEFPIPAHPTNIPLENAHIIITEKRVNVRLQTGFSIIVENSRNLYLNVYGSGAHRNKGKGFMGIFGNLGNDVQNELTSQDGFVIPPTSENLRDLSLLHYRFGLTWMTTANESLFVYEDGKSWEDYVNPDFIPNLKYPDPATMPEEVRAICGDSMFCFSEYMATGDLEMAADVVIVEQGLDELREEVRKVQRPMCDVLRSPDNGRVHVSGYFNGSIATYSCDKEYEFISGDMTRTCSASENESHWTGVPPVCIWTCTACQQNSGFQVSHDPADCTRFFLCSMGQMIRLPCKLNSAFNPVTLECDKNYVCRDPPGC